MHAKSPLHFCNTYLWPLVNFYASITVVLLFVSITMYLTSACQSPFEDSVHRASLQEGRKLRFVAYSHQEKIGNVGCCCWWCFHEIAKLQHRIFIL